MAVRIQFRRGTASQWSGVNPILAEGEVGFETDTRKFKVGTGDKRWNDPDFPYYAVGTITGVIAGSGLTGGGYSGNVTLDIDGTVLTTDYMSAKGDLITATGDNAPTLLPVGTTDTHVLQVDAAQPTGLKYGQVQTTGIANNAVTEVKILDTSITTAKLNDGAVTAGKLATNAVTSTKIAANAVTEDKIASGSVSTTKIANNAVNTAQIADNAVTGAKFADNSVTSAKIANETIVNEDINNFANIGLTKLASGALPTSITVTTDNYIDRSVGITKLNNTVGSEGVGIWQTWTPTVTGLNSNQWVSVYCKYMRVNSYCTVQLIIQLQNIASGNEITPTIRFSLPLTPAFASLLQQSTAGALTDGGGAGISFGSYFAWNEDTWQKSDLGTAVYRAGLNVVELWRPTSIGTSDGNVVKNIPGVETGDVISFTATYEVA